MEISMVRSPVSPSSVACGATFPLEGEGCYGGWLRYVVALADFALIRRWRATFPTQGEGIFRLYKVFYVLLLNST
ncbi:MAG: hypothetical protein SOZ51_03345, partial [Eubacteriales bacterium]|nr:hypothetical protein [Eubacteriales bacterium]